MKLYGKSPASSPSCRLEPVYEACLAFFGPDPRLNPTGEALDAGEQAAFESFIRHGGGFVCIHSASDTGYNGPRYGGLVGTYLRRHPVIQPATLKVVDASSESTRHLPIEWKRTDEWYDFRDDLDREIMSKS